jgi:hypothetical protein
VNTCAHYIRACTTYARSHIISRILFPKLVKTLNGLHIFAWHTWFLRIRASACTCAHVCVRICFGLIRSTIVLHWLHAFDVRACVCTLRAHYARACTASMCTFAYVGTDSLQTWWNILWVSGSCMVTWCVRARLCMRLMRMCSRTHAHRHMYYEFAPNMVETLINCPASDGHRLVDWESVLLNSTLTRFLFLQIMYSLVLGDEWTH